MAEKKPNPAPIESGRLLRKQEVLRYLGISNTTLYRLMTLKKNPVPRVRVGAHWRFPFDQLKWWKENQTQ